MILGRVVGELWASRRHRGLDGRKLLIIRPHYVYGSTFSGAHLVAVDGLGAGLGEDVVVCLGEPARRSLGGVAAVVDHAAGPGYTGAAFYPVDAAVMAIVDGIDLPATATLPSRRPLLAVTSGPPRPAAEQP